ncbi:MAG TPA: FHA domain-containing protein [Polyangiaceae bacterium]
MSGSEHTIKDINPAELGVTAEPGVEVLPDATVVVVGGPSAGKIFPLHGGDVLIGRVKEARIRIDEKAVSARHARIMNREGGHVIVDLGSTNGTLLNGKRLNSHQPAELAPGDSIQVAETVLAYLPSNVSDTQEQTHYLAKALPQVPAGSTALTLGEAASWGDQAILARLLAAQPAVPAEPPPPTLEERIEQIMRILRMIKRNWVPIFAAVAVCALLSVARVLIMPPPSEATFTIRISPSKTDEQAAPFDREQRGFYTSVEQGFMSDALIEKTMMSFNPERPSREVLDLVKTTALKFESTAYRTYEGTFKNPDPDRAVEFLKRHLENFLAAETAKTLRGAQAEVTFLENRVKQVVEELRRIEAENKAFKDKYLVGLPEFSQSHVTTRETLLQRRADLSAQLTRNQLELKAARTRLSDAAPLAMSAVAAAQPYEQGLIEVKRKLSELRGKGLGDQHPEVAALRKQETDLQRLADAARAKESSVLDRNANVGLVELKNKVMDLDVAVRGTQAELGAVSGQITRLDGILSKTPEVESKWAELTRTYTVSKDQHDQLSTQLRAAQLKLDLERTSARARYEVLSPPQTSGVEMRKALLKGTAIGVALGLILGAGIAAYMELRRYLREQREKRTAIVRAGAEPPAEWLARR